MDKQNKANFKILSVLLLAIFIAIFAVLNSDKVAVNFIFAKVYVSQSIVILISVTLGAVLMYVNTLIYLYKSRKKKALQGKLTENEIKDDSKNIELDQIDDVKVVSDVVNLSDKDVINEDVINDEENSDTKEQEETIEVKESK